MRLIDADALIEKFGKLTVELWLDSVEEAEIVSLIGNAPTIEPKQGEWIESDIATYKCSECGKIQIADDINELNYCCCCGSRNKMGRSRR